MARKSPDLRAMPKKKNSTTATPSDPSQQYRSIQQRVDRRQTRSSKSNGGQSAKSNGGKSEQKEGAQTGARRHPTVPLPKQHQPKPGLESKIRPQPQYEAPNYKGSDKLRGMTALVTGGDSGIGRAVAVLYAREGANVAIVYLPVEQSDAEQTCEAVEREGGRCLLIPGDVSDSDFCQRAVRRTIEAFGKLDILVNNAAFQQHVEKLEELSDEQFDRTMKTNLYGYFYMTKAALPHLKQGSSIINTGSVTGIEGSPKLLDYSATKGAIHTFTRSLSENVLDRGIRVNAVAPGPVWTPLNPADQPAEKVSEFGKDTGMGRPAQPEELSPLYVFLAAPVCSSYITGEIVPVIGGYQP